MCVIQKHRPRALVHRFGAAHPSRARYVCRGAAERPAHSAAPRLVWD